MKNTFLFVLKRLYDGLDEEFLIIEADETKFPTNIGGKVTDNYSHEMTLNNWKPRSKMFEIGLNGRFGYVSHQRISQ